MSSGTTTSTRDNSNTQAERRQDERGYQNSKSSGKTFKKTQPKPEDVEFLSLLDRMESTSKLPEAYGNIGRYKTYLDSLIEGLDQDGLDGFKRAKTAILNKEKQLSSLYAMHQGDQAQAESEQEQYFKFLDFKDLRSLPKPEWLLYDVLPTKGINFLYGKEGCGKTYVATGIAIAVASETLSWLGRMTKHGHVLYIAAEDIDEVALRFIGAANYYGLDDIPNLHVYPCPLSLATDTPKLIESLERQYAGINPSLIIVDTLAMCSIGIEENSAKEFGQVISSLEMLWRKYNCCIVAAHHSGKNGEMRGTSAMDGVAYSKVQVSEVDENVMLHSVKKRRGKAFDDIYLDRKIVEIPHQLDEMLQPVTTCVLVKSDRTAAAEPTTLTKLQQEILEHLANLGGSEVARSELMKACMIDQARERGFINAVSGLIHKGRMSMSKVKQRTSYSLVKASEVTE